MKKEMPISRLGDEDAPPVLLGGQALVHNKVDVVQCLHFRSEDAPAVLRVHGEKPLPAIQAEAALPEFQRPVASEFRVGLTN